jgi:hypothetical protein
MTPAQIQEAIQNIVATATSAAALSDRLFSPDGLFNCLATTADERRRLVGTPLFREAQKRFRELQLQEAALFKEAVREAKIAFSEYEVKVER